jgi:hypothetical protein
MPNTKSILATVISEFTLYLGDCQQDSYDFNIEVRPAGDLNTTFVRLLLQGDGLAVWVNGEAYSTADLGSLEDDIYRSVRDLPVVKRTINEINLRADRRKYDADI